MAIFQDFISIFPEISFCEDIWAILTQFVGQDNVWDLGGDQFLSESVCNNLSEKGKIVYSVSFSFL